jgi:hypothetical protein
MIIDLPTTHFIFTLEGGELIVGGIAPNGDWYEPWKMQFSGYRDKNGNEIYEGDKWQYDDYIGIVEFVYGSWNFIQAPDSGCNFCPAFFHIAKYGKVIGNIYES